MVGIAGATDLPRALRDSFAPAGERTHISKKLKHVWHLGQSQTCCFGYTAVSLQEWVTAILQCHFSIRWNQFAKAARRKSQILFQKLPVLPAPFCTKTSICLAKISLCSVSFNLDHFLGLLLCKSKKGLCGVRDKNGQAAAPAPGTVTAFHYFVWLHSYGTSCMIPFLDE